MLARSSRRALVVRGGWDGHQPVQTTDSFVPFLTANGFQLTVSDSLDVYTDTELMADVDLVIQTWTMGEITPEQAGGLIAAVEAGTGFGGWHGGIVDSFRGSVDYQRLTGGQFLCHPGGFVDYEIEVVAEHRDHPIMVGIERVALHTEQYWILSDGASDVLATTTIPAGSDTAWATPITCPAVWTRTWGAGRVFVSTVGHHLPDLDVPQIRTLTERGLLWASR